MQKIDKVSGGWVLMSDECIEDIPFIRQWIIKHSYIKNKILTKIHNGNFDKVSSDYAHNVMKLVEAKKDIKRLNDMLKRIQQKSPET
jgi:hypothetical protein